MAGNTLHLPGQQANILCPPRRFHTHQLFDRPCIGNLVEQRGKIIRIIHIADTPHHRAILQDLLYTPVQIPNHGVQSTTVSPSSLSTSRKTPCVLGCCGPIFNSISCDVMPSGPISSIRFTSASRFIAMDYLLSVGASLGVPSGALRDLSPTTHLCLSNSNLRMRTTT